MKKSTSNAKLDISIIHYLSLVKILFKFKY